MRRNLVLTVMALLVAIVGVRPIFAQDFDFTAIPKIVTGLTNQGAVGALSASSPRAGLLGSATPTALAGFRATDVASSSPSNLFGPEIFAVGTIPAATAGGARRNRLIVLAAIGDGTFSFPQSIRLAGTPTSLAVFDIDLD